MRTTYIPCLLLLAGCASARAVPAEQRKPVITRIVSAQPVADTAAKGVIELVDAPCSTGDRMPTALYRADDLPLMPSAEPAALPYIPNVCPVIAAPGGKAASPAALQRGPKRIRPRSEP